MTKTLRIVAGAVSARAVWDALPIEAVARTWGDECRPASPVNVFGRVDGDPRVFKTVPAGARIRLRTDRGRP